MDLKKQKLFNALDTTSPETGFDCGDKNLATARHWFVGLESAFYDGADCDAPLVWSDVMIPYYARLRRIYTSAGVDVNDVFLGNLYPLRRADTNSIAEIAEYGFESVSEYKAQCNKHGRAAFGALGDAPLSGKRIIVCNGIGDRDNFLAMLRITDIADEYDVCFTRANDGCGGRCTVIMPKNHDGIAALVLIYHISWINRWGGMAYCDAVADVVRRLADNQ